jgi:glycosyltransferase involved in cell wall biosynthesis
MRLVHVTPVLYDQPIQGGGARYVSEFIRAVAAEADFESVTCVVAPSGAMTVDGRHMSPPAGVRTVARLLDEATIVHAHHLNSLAFDLSVVLARATGASLALTDHGGGWRTPGRLFGRLRLRPVDAILAVSEYSLADLGPRQTPATMAILKGGGDHVLRPRSVKTFPPVDFLFMGRLIAHKGIHVLIEALPPGRSLRVAGAKGYESYFSMLQEKSRGKDVTFHLNPTEDELAPLYASADYTVVPSVYQAMGKVYRRPELLGLVLLESLACGTPCVGSSAGGLPEVLAEARMPVVPAGDVQALRLSLSELPRSSDGSYQVFRERAESAARNFTWASVAKRAVETYSALP